MATADKLNKLIEKSQNATVSMPFADYANMVLGITTETGEIETGEIEVEIIGEPTPVEPTPVEPTPVEPTPVEPTPNLVNVLKAGTAKVGGATDTYVDNVRTENDAIPVSSPFELRQWAAPWGGINIPATDLKPNTFYTLVLEIEFLNNVDTFWFELSENWFGGSFFKDNVPITVTPSYGQYPLKQHINSTGKTKFYYKFKSGANVPSNHYLGIRADNAPNNTKVVYHRFKLFEGDVNP